MNAGFFWCIAPAIVFLIFALIFHFAKERATFLISGFNGLSKEEQGKYDQKAMTRDYRNDFLLWSIVMAVGAFLSWLISSKAAFLTYILWILLFLKDFHLDVDHAFRKYRLKP